MALTELQLPSKDLFYTELQNAATQMNSVMHAWKDIAEFIASMDSADLDSIGVAIGQVRADLVDFRTAMQELTAFFDGTSTAQTVVPGTIVDKIRRIR